jgi:hypothetical protein
VIIVSINPNPRTENQSYVRNVNALVVRGPTTLEAHANIPGGAPAAMTGSLRWLLDGSPITLFIASTTGVWRAPFDWSIVPDGSHRLSFEVQGGGHVYEEVEVTVDNILGPVTGPRRISLVPFNYDLRNNVCGPGGGFVDYSPGQGPRPDPLTPRPGTPFSTRLSRDKLWVERMATSASKGSHRRFYEYPNGTAATPTGDVGIWPQPLYHWYDAPSQYVPGFVDGERNIGEWGNVWQQTEDRRDHSCVGTNIGGQVKRCDLTGKITTLIGWRLKKDRLHPYYGEGSGDPSWFRDHFELVGRFPTGVPYLKKPWGAFQCPWHDNDWYTANSGFHCWMYWSDREAEVERVVSIYAGSPIGQAGYRDGPRETALFNWPWQGGMRTIFPEAEEGRTCDLYSTDKWNHAIRVVKAQEADGSPGWVTTLARSKRQLGDTWAPRKLYPPGAVVRPTTIRPPKAAPYLYITDAGGTSSGTEPVWPTSGSVTDNIGEQPGTAVWRTVVGTDPAMWIHALPTPTELGISVNNDDDIPGIPVDMIRRKYLFDGPFDQCSCTTPEAFQWANKEKTAFIVVERATMAQRLWDLKTRTVRTIKLDPVDANTRNPAVDVDVDGVFGPVGDVFVHEWGDRTYRTGQDGSWYPSPFLTVVPGSLLNGPLDTYLPPPYPAGVSIHRDGSYWISYIGAEGLMRITQRRADDPTINYTLYSRGASFWRYGSSPALWVLHGEGCQDQLGGLVAREVLALGDAAARAYLAVPMTDDQWAGVKEYLRVHAFGTGPASPTPPTPPDTAGPSGTITAPIEGEVVTGKFAAVLEISDPSGIDRLEGLQGGALVATDVSAPWAVDFDVTGVSPGPLLLTFRAFDKKGNLTTVTRKVEVGMIVPPDLPADVEITIKKNNPTTIIRVTGP